MRSIRQRVFGKLLTEDATTALWLADDVEPVNGIAPDQQYLRYALTIRGSESLVFPALILDDYGNRVRKLKLYEWLRTQGDYHPRSEVFGYEQSGKETQHFVRELEIYFKYPVFVYPDLETPLQKGVQLSKIVLLNNNIARAEKTERPAETKSPLRRAAVEWWHMPIDDLRLLIDD